MNYSILLEGLNQRQREAVSSPQTNMLVLAGAGSGKTRVLVHRLAWLLQNEQCLSSSLLAVTFTNKAALEMRNRVEQLLGDNIKGILLGTFHSIAYRLLRLHCQEAKLSENFQVLDSDDQYRLIKRTIIALGFDDKHYLAKQSQLYINNKKDHGVRPQQILSDQSILEKTQQQIYQAYQDHCNMAGLVDFAELLLRSYELLKQQLHLRSYYQQRFSNILVDEFQDTNSIQYDWLKLLITPTNYLTAVGDDDQSIYGWRGSKIENLHHLASELNGVVTIRLEQNYRSTGAILKGANGLISHNIDRLGKKLWTQYSEGEPITIYQAINELDEIHFVIKQISQRINEGSVLKNCAILYRNNAQSRVLEEALMYEGIPYHIYGGLRFFDRQEIKDTLAYLRLLANTSDDAAFERIVNRPSRGIGDGTLSLLRDNAKKQGISLWESANYLMQQKQLKRRAAIVVNQFVRLILQLKEQTNNLPLFQQVDKVITDSGILAMYQEEAGGKAETREVNLQELISACKYFNSKQLTATSLMQDFLVYAALESEPFHTDKTADAVQLMTLHSAKGLEFAHVFIVGMEEGIFPSHQAMVETGRIQEERRLCYVGMTRAMQTLDLCFTKCRRLYGRLQNNMPSRFIAEIPTKYTKAIGLSETITTMHSRCYTQKPPQPPKQNSFSLGQLVEHPTFGVAIVTNYDDREQQGRIQVQFDEGSKWLVTGYAKLKKL